MPTKRDREEAMQRRQSLALAFERAERQDAELRRLKAQYPHYSGLYFGRSDYDAVYAAGGVGGNGSSPR
jgi:hypothetical protein